MNRITEIEELGFPKSLIIRENALVSELIDTNDLIKELNEQLRLYNVVGQSEQLANFCKKISKQEDCPVEFQESVNKEFWNLIG